MLGLRAVRQVLIGVPGDLPRPAVALAAQVMISLAVTTANIVGAVIVVALLVVALPTPDEASGLFGGLILGGTAIYLGVALLFGTVRGLRLASPVVRSFKAGDVPSEEERAAVLRLPVALTRMQATLWAGGALAFGGLSCTQSVLLGFEVAITVLLGGVATSGISYLQVQRLLRGAVHVVLTDSPPRRREVPGVGTRLVLVWLVTTAVPVAGALTVAVFALAIDEVSSDELAVATIALCGVGLFVGFLATFFLARTLSDPLRRLRDAFADVEEGDLEVEVPVFDATEVGYAAAGFNRMLDGLRERERLHDLFGRQVGVDVARRALEEGVTLGGEEREAAVLFVDVVGSTAFAADRPPTEVVDVLNRFFEAVVAVTLEHGGLVNKFIGDAALCVFGAPLARDDPAGSALAAGRAMCERLRGFELDTGIGVSAGTVVAGNVGTADRYEYTVIGDPVNEAARLTELAKDRDGRLLASEAAVERAAQDEARHWALGDTVQLRGRTRATRLAEVRP